MLTQAVPKGGNNMHRDSLQQNIYIDLMDFRVATGVSKLKPGITGWAQINGRDEISIAQKVQLEQEYLIKKSFLFDVEIIIKTFTNVLFSKGVSH